MTEHHLECLSLKGGCRGSSESTHFKMPYFWKFHALAQLFHLYIVLFQELPDTIHVCGRINPEHVWDYLSKVKQAASRVSMGESFQD